MDLGPGGLRVTRRGIPASPAASVGDSSPRPFAVTGTNRKLKKTGSSSPSKFGVANENEALPSAGLEEDSARCRLSFDRDSTAGQNSPA